MDMNANGVLGRSASRPSHFGPPFARTEDSDVALAMVRAYNDWHIEDWCGTAPALHPVLAARHLGPAGAFADEVRRTAAKGAHAVTFENLSKLGWPSFHSDHWDPVLTACSDEDVVVCPHIGSSSQLASPRPTRRSTAPSPLTPATSCRRRPTRWSPVLREVPRT